MKSIIVNLKHSRLFFINVMKSELQKSNSDDKPYQEKCMFSYMANDIISKLDAPSNIHKPNFYRLTVPECVSIMLSVSEFDLSCFISNHSLMLSQNKDKFKKQSLISDYYNSKTLIKFWVLIKKAGVNNQRLNQVMQPLIYRNQYLKSLLNK